MGKVEFKFKNSVALMHEFADIPKYRFLSFCTADTDANTDIFGNKLH